MGNRPVKADVVEQILSGIVDGGVHLSQLFGNHHEMLFLHAFGGQRGEIGREQLAGFDQRCPRDGGPSSHLSRSDSLIEKWEGLFPNPSGG